MVKKLKYVAVVVGAVVIAVILWNIASGLVNMGGSVKDVLPDETMETYAESSEYVVEREAVETQRGTVRNQVGTAEEKSVQCVYDFFNEFLPELGYMSQGYEIKEISEGKYCVRIADWYVFVNHENNISYPYKFTKSVEFTDEEKELLLSKFESSSFTKEGDVYVWEAD